MKVYLRLVCVCALSAILATACGADSSSTENGDACSEEFISQYNSLLVRIDAFQYKSNTDAEANELIASVDKLEQDIVQFMALNGSNECKALVGSSRVPTDVAATDFQSKRVSLLKVREQLDEHVQSGLARMASFRGACNQTFIDKYNALNKKVREAKENVGTLKASASSYARWDKDLEAKKLEEAGEVAEAAIDEIDKFERDFPRKLQCSAQSTLAPHPKKIGSEDFQVKREGLKRDLEELKNP